MGNRARDPLGGPNRGCCGPLALNSFSGFRARVGGAVLSADPVKGGRVFSVEFEVSDGAEQAGNGVLEHTESGIAAAVNGVARNTGLMVMVKH